MLTVCAYAVAEPSSPNVSEVSRSLFHLILMGSSYMIYSGIIHMVHSVHTTHGMSVFLCNSISNFDGMKRGLSPLQENFNIFVIKPDRRRISFLQ